MGLGSTVGVSRKSGVMSGREVGTCVKTWLLSSEVPTSACSVWHEAGTADAGCEGVGGPEKRRVADKVKVV